MWTLRVPRLMRAQHKSGMVHRRRGNSRSPQLFQSGPRQENRPDGVLPWGSFAKPDFGAIRKSTSLTPAQVGSLIHEYLPQDRVDICKQREKTMKHIHRLMRTKDFAKLGERLTELRSGVVPLEESTFIAMIFGHLQLKDGLSQAESVLTEMNKSDFIHPSFKQAVSSFLSSLRTLEQFDAYPNRTALLKAYIPFSELAIQVRKMRILAFRVAMDDRVKKGEILLPNDIEDEVLYDSLDND